MAHNDDVRFPINPSWAAQKFEPPMVSTEDIAIHYPIVKLQIEDNRPVCKCAYCGRYAPAADFECPRCGAPLPLGDNP